MDRRGHDQRGVRDRDAAGRMIGTLRERAWPADRAATVLLLAAILATWLPSLGASFQFDDWNVIVRDPRVQSLAAWLAGMPGIRPLLKLSYALNHESGAGVAAFRLVNVAVHALNSVLVLCLLRALGRHLALPPSTTAFAALCAAAAFALHPVQTEAVTYVSGRSSSLSAAFALLALLSWLRGLGGPDERRWRVWSCVLFALALGVKEPVAVLPGVMAAWLWITGEARTIPRRIAPHLLLLLAGAALLLAWPPYRAVLEGSLDARSIGSNLLTQVNAVSWLIGQLVRFDRLNADPALATVTTIDGPLVLRALLLLGSVGGALALRRRFPAGAFAIAWFFLWLLPTNSLLPRLDVVNERQLYLALVGPAWMLGLGLARIPSALAHWRWIALAALILTLAAATLARNRVYADEIVFWQDVTRKAPHNARAANNLGYAYALTCRDADALAEFERAIGLDPQDYRAPINQQLLSEGRLFADNQRQCPTAQTATR
ncbi:MAG: tetratricopeptide repeat protein [Steroidobacteraceae bacterium]|nr:tetratricopeptide repeat protein [Nevskiaceae bacterium]MCP5360824.1 tetratricopeptide repeat protein [Nevskiaceae bacterium]MCP5470993.1 tetratricopeptide repeat protein [Nevskiaceae bacterium]